MGKQVLLLRLEGPLQSWGSRARWDVRDTDLEPTKSGVVGLIACALGYRGGDPRLEDELDRGLRFGVRVERQGTVMEDFQTISGILPLADGGYRHGGGTVAASGLARLLADPLTEPATILSPRSYLQDAAFLAALEATAAAPESLLDRIAAALRRPVWPVYLGRKSCPPSRPVFEALSDRFDDIEEALRKHPWSTLGARGEKRPDAPASCRAVVEDSAGMQVRQDAVRTGGSRFYGFRNVRSFDVEYSQQTEGDTQ